MMIFFDIYLVSPFKISNNEMATKPCLVDASSGLHFDYENLLTVKIVWKLLKEI